MFNYTIRKTIECGGDTDTNACIVGGMIGALIGFKSIDKFLIGKVFSFDCTKDGIDRPLFLSTKHYSALIIKSLIERRSLPGDTLEILNDYKPEDQD